MEKPVNALHLFDSTCYYSFVLNTNILQFSYPN